MQTSECVDGQMQTFEVIEYEYIPKRESYCATGRVFTYLASSSEEAMRHCLYYHQLSDGKARLGPTGLVVHSKGHNYVLKNVR